MSFNAVRMGDIAEDASRRKVDSLFTIASGIPALGVVCSLAGVVFYGFRIVSDLLLYIDDGEPTLDAGDLVTGNKRLEGHLLEDGDSMRYHCINAACLGCLGMNVLASSLEMSMTANRSDRPGL